MTKPLLFPLELYRNPIVTSLNLCQAGLFRLLIESYWKSGIALPESDYALIRLSNADLRTFKKYGKKVKEALKETMPLFEEARAKRQFVRVKRQNHAIDMVSKRINKRNKGKLLVEPIPENQAPLIPQFSALSEKLHRERQLVQLPKPQHRQNERKPGLTEKPKG